jgi:hypothetical protein
MHIERHGADAIKRNIFSFFPVLSCSSCYCALWCNFRIDLSPELLLVELTSTTISSLIDSVEAGLQLVYPMHMHW